MPAFPPTLSADQAASLLGMSPQSIRRQISAGTFAFPSRKSGSTYLIPARPIYDFLGLEPEQSPAA